MSMMNEAAPKAGRREILFSWVIYRCSMVFRNKATCLYFTNPPMKHLVLASFFWWFFSAIFHFPGSLGLSQAQDDFILLKGKGCRDQIFRTSTGPMNAAFVVVIQFVDGLESSIFTHEWGRPSYKARVPGWTDPDPVSIIYQDLNQLARSGPKSDSSRAGIVVEPWPPIDGGAWWNDQRA